MVPSFQSLKREQAVFTDPGGLPHTWEVVISTTQAQKRMTKIQVAHTPKTLPPPPAIGWSFWPILAKHVPGHPKHPPHGGVGAFYPRGGGVEPSL